jgi:hypothetical protein
MILCFYFNISQWTRAQGVKAKIVYFMIGDFLQHTFYFQCKKRWSITVSITPKNHMLSRLNTILFLNSIKWLFYIIWFWRNLTESRKLLIKLGSKFHSSAHIWFLGLQKNICYCLHLWFDKKNFSMLSYSKTWIILQKKFCPISTPRFGHYNYNLIVKMKLASILFLMKFKTLINYFISLRLSVKIVLEPIFFCSHFKFVCKRFFFLHTRLMCICNKNCKILTFLKSTNSNLLSKTTTDENYLNGFSFVQFIFQ